MLFIIHFRNIIPHSKAIVSMNHFVSSVVVCESESTKCGKELLVNCFVVSCTDFSSDSDVNVPTSQTSHNVHTEKQPPVLKSSKSKYFSGILINGSEVISNV